MAACIQDRQSFIVTACSQLIRRVLAEKNWRAAQLAAELGVHPDLVRRWVRGERLIQLDDLLTVADMVGASLDEVFGRTPQYGQASGADTHIAPDVAIRVIQDLASLLSPAGQAVDSSILPRTLGEGASIVDARQQISAKSQRALDDLLAECSPRRARRSA